MLVTPSKNFEILAHLGSPGSKYVGLCVIPSSPGDFIVTQRRIQNIPVLNYALAAGYLLNWSMRLEVHIILSFSIILLLNIIFIFCLCHLSKC